ncbi:hypothetical protein [Nostoc sp.]|uniref:hypothetical protein n=1 Tax=Nostoc sp. TaxID=1180 RepID=UPI002FF94B05
MTFERQLLLLSKTLREQVGRAGRQSPQVGKPAHGAGSPTHWLLLTFDFRFAVLAHSPTITFPKT